MNEIWEKASINKEVIHLKNFHSPEITWDDVLNFIYKESTLKSDLEKEVKDGTSYPNKIGHVVGNLYIDTSTYLLPQTSALHNEFKGVSELMEKVNGSASGNNCDYYNGPIGKFNCSCKLKWHIQGLRFCISDKVIGNHNDPCNVLYWQILGNSYWTINDDITYTLEPGDLLYFNKSDTHRVTHKGPRVGIIIDGKKG